MKKRSAPTYTKGRPIGQRSVRRARVSSAPVQSLAMVRRRVPSSVTPRSRARLTATQRLQRKAARLLAARRFATQQRAAALLKTFFTRTLAQSAGMLALLLVFGLSYLGNAQSSTRTFTASPDSCTGWEQPERVVQRDLLASDHLEKFTTENSATIASRKSGEAVGEPQLKCKGFALPQDFPSDAELKHIQLAVSLAAQGNVDSEDALVIESSLDGQQWTTLDSFFLTEDTSNALHGGYRTYPFAALNRDNLSSLHVRVRFATVPSDISVRAYVDGMALEIDAMPLVSAASLNLPANVIQIEDKTLATSEEPIVKVEVEKSARMKFLGFKDTKRTIDSVKVETPEGKVQIADYDAQNVAEGSVTYAKLNIHTDTFTKPGKYTAQVTVLQDGKLAVVTTDFTWGVLVMNMNRSVYWPGETVYFGMGVLDPEGHTLCDARLHLTVVAPDGSIKILTTEQDENGVQRSSTCGPDNVTDVADYSAEYETFDEGTYNVTLKAITKSGEYTITDSVIVDAVIPYAISRRGSMRIYPPEAYTMALDVRPQKAFQGIVEDYVPPSFDISKVSDGGKVIKGQQRTTIRWQVDWASRTTHTLTYRYDAPDISPELFRLGPVQVGDYQESRQWQIASDAIGASGTSRSWMTGFELQSTAADVEFESSSGTMSISTSTYRSGAAAFRSNPSSSTGYFRMDLFASSNTAIAHYFRFYVNFATRPNAAARLLTIYDNGNTVQATIRYDNTNNTLELWDDDGTAVDGTPEQVGGDSAAISTSTWYRIEMRVDFGTAATGDTILAARLDGTEFASSTNRNWANGFRYFYMGTAITNSTTDMFIDDVAVNAETATINVGANEGWPGEGKIIYLAPNADGTNVAWTDSGGNAVDYDEVDDIVDAVGSVAPDDGTSYINCTAGSQLQDFALTNATSNGVGVSDRIRVVTAYARIGGSTAANHTYSIVMGLSGTYDTATSVTHAVTGYFPVDDTATQGTPKTTIAATGLVNTGQISYDKPGATTNPWTPADVDSAEVRISSQATCSTSQSRITAVYVMVEYVPAEGGRQWTSGFELQSATAGVEYTANINTPVIDTSTYRYGAASLETLVSGSASTEGMRYRFAASNTLDDFFFRTYIRVATAPSAQSQILLIEQTTGGDVVSLRMNTDRTLELWDEDTSAAQIGSDSAALALNTWYLLELKVDCTSACAGSGNATVEARIDSKSFVSSTSANFATGISDLNLGILQSATAEYNFDDVAINRGVGATQNSWPGPGAVVAMQPDSVGANTAWAVSVSCAAVDYTCVDEVTPNDATDAVATTTLNQIEDSNLESASSAGIGTNDSITLVHVGARFNASSAAATAAKIRLNTGTAGFTIESDAVEPSTTTWTTNQVSDPMAYPITAYDQPHTTTGWTPSALDSIQIGARLSYDNTNNFQLSTVWAMVEYVPKITFTFTISDTTENSGYNCSTDSGGALLIGTSTNGGPTRTATNAGTAFSCTTTDALSNPVTVYPDAPQNAGDPVAVFAQSSETFQATVVVLATSTTASITSDNDMYQTRIVLGHRNAGPVTNASLAAADNGDAGIRYAVSGSDLTTDSGIELHVLYFETYTSGGAVTTQGGNLHLGDGAVVILNTSTHYIDGDIELYRSIGSTSLTINSDIEVAGGDIRRVGNSSVITTTSGTPTVTITGTGTLGSATYGTGTTTFYNLNIGSGGTPATTTLEATVTVNNDFTINPTSTFTQNDPITVNGNASIGASGTWTSGAVDYTVTGTTSIEGTFANTGSSATKRHVGLVTVQSGGTWNNSGNSAINFRGGLTNDSSSTFTAGSGVYTFDTNAQAIGGTNAISIPSVTVTTVTLTNNGTLTVSTALAGTGNLTNGAAGVLYLTLDTTNLTITTLDASTSGNTVHYSRGGAQTVRPSITYHHLTLSGSGIKTLTSVTTINGDLTMAGSATATITSITTIGGDVTVDSSNTLTISANTTVNGGAIVTTGTGATIASSGTPTVTLSGTGNLGGNGTSPSITFYDFTKTTSGTTSIASNFTVSHDVTIGNSTTLGGTDVSVTMTVGNDLTLQLGGTLNTSANVALTCTDGTCTNGGSSSATYVINSLTTSGTGTITQDRPIRVNGDLTIGGTTTYNANYYTEVNGGDITGAGTLTYSSGTPEVQLNGVGAFGGSSNNWTFYDLNFTVTGSDQTTTTSAGAGEMIIDHEIQIDSAGEPAVFRTLDAGTLTWRLRGSGTPMPANGGRLNGNTSTFVYEGSSATYIGVRSNVSNNFYYNLHLEPAGGVPSYTFLATGANAYQITNNLSFGTGTVDLYVDGITYNPNITLGANGTFSCASGIAPITVDTGTGTWTSSGTVNLTNCDSFNSSSGHTLVMSGTAKTLTTGGQYLDNLTLSGTITLANETVNLTGNLVLSNTVTPGTSTVNMVSSGKTITGGGFSLYNLTINPSSAGAITLQTSDLTVTNTLNIAVSDALTINSGRTLTHTGSTLTLSGTLNGPGTYIYRSLSSFPTTGTLAASLILRMDASAGNQTLGARTDYQLLEIDNSSTTAGRTVTAALGTITTSGKLELMNTGTGSSTTTFELNTNDPTFTVGGDTTIAASTTLSAPSANGLFLKGSYTNSGAFTDNAGTVTLNGTGTQTMNATMTGSTADFSTLTITNTNGTYTNDSCGTPSAYGVIFAASVTTATLNIATAGVKVQFLAGSTVTVSSVLNLQGGSGNRVVLRSSTTSAWTLAAPATQTVTYVDVSYSTATGNTVLADDGTNKDCNNNTNWTFATGIDVSGTSNSSGGTVRVAVNGTEQAQTTTLAATWTITGVSVSSGNVVVVYVEGVDGAETTGVSQYDGTGNMDGFVLDTNVLTIGNDDNQSIDLTDLAGYDCDNDEDVMFSSNGGTFAVQGCTNSYTDETLSVKASNTLAVGNSQVLTTDNLTNAGTVTSGTLGAFTVAGNWTNSSTFTPSTSTVTFSATDTGHTINNGASSFYNVIFDGASGAWSPLTNTFTATNDLTMTNGTFNTATGTANVTVNGNVQCGATCGTITMNTAGTNTFTQSVAASKAFGTNVAVATNWTFYNLTFTASSGTPTITTNGTGTGQIIVANTLATTNSGTSLVVDNETNDRILDVNGAVIIGSGTTLQASSTAAFTVAGNWTNNGDFTDGTGTVTLDGASQQTVDGQLTGASDRFYDLTITNASGSDPDSSPSVIFAASAETADDFTASTANTKLRFVDTGTFTFQKITFNGQAAGTRVALRSSTPGTQWDINVAGTRSVQYTDVKDSNACGQAPDIQADDGTNANGGNNTCWKITTLTVTLSGVTAALGTLSTGFVNQAGITSDVTTSASGGYVSMVKYNNTLTSSSDTIDDTTGGTIVAGTEEFGASSSDSGNTIGVWSPTACSTTASTSNATALTTAFQAFASAASVVTNEVTTLCFLASISGTTPAGSYTSTATVVTTARF